MCVCVCVYVHVCVCVCVRVYMCRWLFFSLMNILNSEQVTSCLVPPRRFYV